MRQFLWWILSAFCVSNGSGYQCYKGQGNNLAISECTTVGKECYQTSCLCMVATPILPTEQQQPSYTEVVFQQQPSYKTQTLDSYNGQTQTWREQNSNQQPKNIPYSRQQAGTYNQNGYRPGTVNFPQPGYNQGRPDYNPGVIQQPGSYNPGGVQQPGNYNPIVFPQPTAVIRDCWANPFNAEKPGCYRRQYQGCLYNVCSCEGELCNQTDNIQPSFSVVTSLIMASAYLI